MAPKKKSALHPSAAPRTVLPGSEKPPFVPTIGEKHAPLGEKLTVSVVVQRKTPLPRADRLGKQRLTHAQFRKHHAADPEAVKLVHAFAKDFGLTVAPDTPGPERRTVKLSGTVATMQKAFGVTLVHKTHEGKTYRVREGSITLPSELVGPVEAVLGLDNRPQATPHFRIFGETGDRSAKLAQGGGFAKPHADSADVSYSPVQVAALYQFPTGASASGQTIGIIELGGGYRTKDISAYFKSIGQKTPSVTAVSVDGGKNSPSTASSADGEVMLDIEVAAAVAPGAKIVVYFTPNTDQGFIDAIATAVHDTTHNPSVISISWGGPESTWTSQSMTALDAACQSAAALGITITVAAGDNGSTDGVTDGANHVDFPASSPHVLACGGTKLIGSGSTITSEVVWNELTNNEGATGGGVSNVFPLPSWQSNANVPAPTVSGGGRGVPDVSGDADPSSGYVIRVDGQSTVIGGTSAVAPLWAGLIAMANAQNGKSAGFIQPTIYAASGKSAFNDITSGTNYSGTPVGFKAGPGWDACTGLGSPIGTRLIALVNPSASASNGKMGKKKKSAKPVKTVKRKTSKK
jgi:kumamolisin